MHRNDKMVVPGVVVVVVVRGIHKCRSEYKTAVMWEEVTSHQDCWEFGKRHLSISHPKYMMWICSFVWLKGGKDIHMYIIKGRSGNTFCLIGYKFTWYKLKYNFLNSWLNRSPVSQLMEQYTYPLVETEKYVYSHHNYVILDQPVSETRIREGLKKIS